MKKSFLFLLVMLFSLSLKGYSQTATPTDFFTGTWEIVVVGTPNGDARLITDLSRKDGKLTGELKDPTGTMKEALPITKIDEEAGKLTIYFNSSQAGEISIELAKVDDDHLKGTLMGMFESTAVRVKK